MGREVRKVVAGWEHPKDEDGEYIPLLDESYDQALHNYTEDCAEWNSKGRSEAFKKYGEDYSFEEWRGEMPTEDCYRPHWEESDRTCIQMYETVTEGTPVSPVFSTPQELIDYLVAFGDFSDQERGNGGWSKEGAERFVKSEYAPTGIIFLNTDT